ncbi:MAG: cell division protein FtsZ [Rikenellaceae bacterium]|nr:cell division protein FtsZ [Rikenellaceae bacterium]
MAEDLMAQVKAERESKSIITVMGVGGAGGNAVRRMWNMGIEGVTFMVCNTDSQALHKSEVETKIQLGEDGLGAGNDPQKGHDLAVESIEEVRQALKEAGARMVFITAGMGGGTGTGASPVIAELAKEMGLLTVAIVTSPLALEGAERYKQAQVGIEKLRQTVDSLLIINNENIRELYGHMSLGQAFGKADEVLSLATKGIAEIITVESPQVNVDFADVSRVMRGSGRAHMAVAAASGEGRAREAASATLDSPLLDHNQIAGAKNILLNISVDHEDHLIYDEVIEILTFIQQHASVRGEDGTISTANIIWGNSVKPNLGDELEIVLVATGFEGENEDVNSAMERIVAAPSIEPVKPAEEEETSPLEPIKKMQQRPQQQEPTVLGARSNRYDKLGQLLAVPAYQSRNMPLDVSAKSKGKAEEMRDEHAEVPDPNKGQGSLPL